MSKIKSKGRPKGSRNLPKRPGFYKLSPEQIAEYFSDAPYVLVSKDWLLKRIGDNKLFDAFFNAPATPQSDESVWTVQEL
jgi:hypothetical protein